MSDIREGDLVMVVRWPCCHRLIGAIFRVLEFSAPLERVPPICGYCSAAHQHMACATDDKGYNYPLPWLKKIPPLVEPSHTERREEIEA